MDASEQKLCKLLDHIVTNGGKLRTASRQVGFGEQYVWKITKENPVIEWRNEGARPFADHVEVARRMARVKQEQFMRGITINGQPQFVIDPTMLARFGAADDPDAKDLAELTGFADFPYAHDIEGKRIPLLSPRYPRPQRQHRPHPHGGRNRTPPPPNAVREQSSDAHRGTEHKAAGVPWTPNSPLPAYHRDVRAEAEPPRVFVASEASPKVSPLVADLRERLARGPSNPRPVDSRGHLMIPRTNQGHRDDPIENGA